MKDLICVEKFNFVNLLKEFLLLELRYCFDIPTDHVVLTGLCNLTNHQSGTYYGPAKYLDPGDQRRIGVSLLYRAMKVRLLLLIMWNLE